MVHSGSNIGFASDEYAVASIKSIPDETRCIVIKKGIKIKYVFYSV